jgi:hypothetical protein
LSFADLFVPALLFLTLAAFNARTASASPGFFYVSGFDYNKISQYYGVCGYQTTPSLTVTRGVGSFFVLLHSSGEFFSFGFLQGYDSYNHWWANPVYFVDRILGGSYHQWLFGAAPANQNHQYWVWESYLDQMMTAKLDIGGTIVFQESGYSRLGKMASAQTESHDNTDPMNHHFWGLKAALVELRYGAWHDDIFHVDSPYHQNVISATEWFATGP